MNTFDWREFLGRWSQEILASMGERLHQLPAEVIESGWLGYPGATETDIVKAETRLQTKLPPSYREFLKVTNGWRQTTPFIYRIWSIEEVEWFVVRRQEWLEKFVLDHDEFRQIHTHRNNGASLHEEVPDSEYFLYGEQQDCSKLRVNYLRTALEISDRGESSIYLLNPQVVTEDGEWEAWFFGDWLPGADRYPSFKEMMQAEYRIFLELIDSSGEAESDESQPNSWEYTATANRLQQWIDQAKTIKEESSGSNSDIRDNFQKNSSSKHRESNASDDSLRVDDETESARISQDTGWRSDQSFLITYQTRQTDNNPEARLQAQQTETDAEQSWPLPNIEQLPPWILSQIKKSDPSSHSPEQKRPPS